MKRDPEDVTGVALRWLAAGEPVALATVIRTWSSSPRPTGSQMAISRDGRFEGSVSGGCVETAVVGESLAFFEEAAPRTLEFGVVDERAWEVGLACGGRIEVFVGPAERAVLEEIAQLKAARATFGVATDLASGASRVFAESAVPEDLRASWEELQRGQLPSTLVEQPERRCFLRAERPSPRLVIVGAVHLAQVLTQLARIAGFEVMVIDPRAAFASVERFPDVELICEWPTRALDRIGVDRATALVALSHDPKLDDPALSAGLRSRAFYLGALGSRKTQATRRERLAEAGFETRDIDRISGPIGLPIAAKTTGEIAISIVAEIVARRRGAA